MIDKLHVISGCQKILNFCNSVVDAAVQLGALSKRLEICVRLSFVTFKRLRSDRLYVYPSNILMI